VRGIGNEPHNTDGKRISNKEELRRLGFQSCANNFPETQTFF
jgi:hypothetical protein